MIWPKLTLMGAGGGWPLPEISTRLNGAGNGGAGFVNEFTRVPNYSGCRKFLLFLGLCFTRVQPVMCGKASM